MITTNSGALSNFPTHRLVAYFVVFFKNGFTPSDLRRAQRVTGSLAYFTKSSPDFINYTGRSISASDQVTALAEAQSIGK